MFDQMFKIMLISFFDGNGIVHKEFVPPGRNVNQKRYLQVLKRLCDSVWKKKRPEIWSSGDWFLHHDNAPAHTALTVQQFLSKINMTVIPHPPYSPDLAPYYFFLFPGMNCQVKGKRFVDVSEVKKKTLEVLNNISTEELQKCFQQWGKRWYSVLSQKESTLKETGVVIVYNLINHFKNIIPIIFFIMFESVFGNS